MKLKAVILLLLFFSAGVFAQEAVNDKQLLKQQKLVQKEEERLNKEAEKQLKQQMKILEKQEKEAKEKDEKEKNLREKAVKKEQDKQKVLEDKNLKKAMQEKEVLDKKQKEADEERQKREAKESAAALKEQKKLQKEQEKEAEKQKKEERRLQKEREALETPVSKSSLVLDYDLKFRAASFSNLDYTSEELMSDNVFQQYLSVHIIGKFDDRIEMSAKLASSGFAGKLNPVFDMPYAEKDSDYSLFLQTAFLTFKSDAGSAVPYIFMVGKQEFTAGDGLIFDGNAGGMLGARGKTELTGFLEVDAFLAKVPNENFNIYGGTLKIKVNPVIEIGVYQERNGTKALYKKGIISEDPADIIQYDNKTFYDLRLLGGNAKYKYKAEIARQSGELVRSSTDTVDYDTFAFMLEGSWTGKLFKMPSNAKLLFSFANAGKGDAFNPTFTRRYNGLQRIGHGMLFAANNVDSFFTLPDGYSGINTLGFAFNTSPLSVLETGIGLYFYSASDAPADVSSSGISELYGAEADLGNEADIYVKYSYKHYFDAALGFAIYTPPSGADDVFKNTDASYLIQLEVSSKF